MRSFLRHLAACSLTDAEVRLLFADRPGADAWVWDGPKVRWVWKRLYQLGDLLE